MFGWMGDGQHTRLTTRKTSTKASSSVSASQTLLGPVLSLDGLVVGRGAATSGKKRSDSVDVDLNSEILTAIHLQAIMSVNHKILRTANAPQTSPDEIETSLAQALIDLENNVPELKADLRPLQISAAREVDVRGGKKAIVVFVPVPQLKAYRKNQIQQRCVHACRG